MITDLIPREIDHVYGGQINWRMIEVLWKSYELLFGITCIIFLVVKSCRHNNQVSIV